MFVALRLGENSDISKCFEDFVSQALGFLKRFYAAELRIEMFKAAITGVVERIIISMTSAFDIVEFR